jgi:hypothetical protein
MWIETAALSRKVATAEAYTLKDMDSQEQFC